MRFRHGDTLIEVALAIGIFSMVAIAVVAVVSGSMSSAQSALELTITREEIDAQAEALRFIQTSYIASGDTNFANNTKYAELWHAITERAKEPTEEILKYNPGSCAELYDNNGKSGKLNRQGAFVINTRNLGYEINGGIVNNGIDEGIENNETVKIGDILIKPEQDGDGNFYPATTFPRLTYNNMSINDSLLDRDNSRELDRVEGIYVVPVRDNHTTTIVDKDSIDDDVSAYYDFYIRTCWFATGAKRPSTISTVIRLYNPDAIAASDFKDSITLSFNPNDAESPIKATGSIPSISGLPLNTTVELPRSDSPETFSREGFRLVGWSTKRTPKGTDDIYTTTYTTPSSSRSGRVTLFAIWEPIPFNIQFVFNANGGDGKKAEQKIRNVTIGSTVTISSNRYYDSETREYKNSFNRDEDEMLFGGWEDTETSEIYTSSNGYEYTILRYPEKEDPYDPGHNLLTVNLNAYWRSPYNRLVYENVPIDPQECSPFRGCYVTPQVPSDIGLIFVSWCSEPVTNYVTCNGTTYQPDDYFPAERITGEDTTLYPTWKLEEFWVDANIYVNCKLFLPGKAGFNVKTFIDGNEVSTSRNGEVFNGTKIVINDHDFYQPVEFSRMVRIEFYDVEGYHIVNTGSICDRIPNCEVRKEDGTTIVEFIVHNIPEGTVLNTTNQYAINIEPHWVSDEPMVLDEGVEVCNDLEWEPLPKPEEDPAAEPGE